MSTEQQKQTRVALSNNITTSALATLSTSVYCLLKQKSWKVFFWTTTEYLGLIDDDITLHL